MSQVRLRFAPSPTGYLHLGGARTALFNWLFARHHGGRFILRIEDTDLERSTQASIDAILDAMTWLGMDWDEGPFFQTQRLDRYRAAIETLATKGMAYRCTCSAEEVEAKREQALKDGHKPMYDRHCRDLDIGPDVGVPFVWRFRMPLEGETLVDDMVRGPVVFQNAELDDLVLVRSDGVPTYNFCVVVDDADMGMTHVIRGEDHLSNTPKQIQMYQALGLPAPRFGHLPLIKGLSKRKGAQSVQAFREQGLTAAGVVNYLARLGWSHGDQEIFSIAELIELFGMEAVGKAGGHFDQAKMEWVCAWHLHNGTPEGLAPQVLPWLAQLHGVQAEPGDYLDRAIAQVKERSANLIQLAEALLPYFRSLEPDEAAARQLEAAGPAQLRDLAGRLEQVTTWTEEQVGAAFRLQAEALGAKLGKVAQPARAALTGRTASAGIFEGCWLLGQQEAVSRLEAAARRLEAAPGGAA